MREFVERYQRLIAFELPKQHKLAFARSIDIADYYRRHFPVTPRTVFVSRTDHVTYDMWWLCSWCNDCDLGTAASDSLGDSHVQRLPAPRHRVPLQGPALVRVRAGGGPASFFPVRAGVPEPGLVVRLHSPGARGPEGSGISWTVTPNVEVLRSGWREDVDGKHQTLTMRTTGSFDNYAIAVWDLPVAQGTRPPIVQTDAKESILARNRDGQWHAVLVIDLRPDAQLRLTVRDPQ